MERSVLTANLVLCFIFDLHKTHACPFKRRRMQASREIMVTVPPEEPRERSLLSDFPAQVLFYVNSRADISTLIFSLLYSGFVEPKVNKMT